jgi:DNA-binding phage protein
MSDRQEEAGAARVAAGSFAYDHERLLLEVTEAVCRGMDRRGVNRAELARLLGKNRAWVTRLLSHRGNPTLGSLVEVSRALGLRWRVRLSRPGTANSRGADPGPARRRNPPAVAAIRVDGFARSR